MDSYSRRQSARTYSSTSPQSTDNYQPGVDDVSYHYGSVSSSRLRCCRFRARLVPLPLAESARRAAEDLGGRSRLGKFHRSFRERSDGHLPGSSLRSSRACSRPSGRVPDLEELDDRLQSDHGLVWTLCQPDDSLLKLFGHSSTVVSPGFVTRCEERPGRAIGAGVKPKFAGLLQFSAKTARASLSPCISLV